MFLLNLCFIRLSLNPSISILGFKKRYSYLLFSISAINKTVVKIHIYFKYVSFLLLSIYIPHFFDIWPSVLISHSQIICDSSFTMCDV